MPGPPPKRDAERRRTNERPIETSTVDIADLIKREIEVPTPDADWHPIAIEWFESLARSGQAVFYEPSDWWTAYLLAEEISRELQPKPMQAEEWDDRAGRMVNVVKWAEMPMPGAKITAILKGFSALMATEADRRRLAIEIERNRGNIDLSDLPKNVTILDSRRAALEA